MLILRTTHSLNSVQCIAFSQIQSLAAEEAKNNVEVGQSSKRLRSDVDKMERVGKEKKIRTNTINAEGSKSSQWDAKVKIQIEKGTFEPQESRLERFKEKIERLDRNAEITDPASVRHSTCGKVL